MKNYIPLFLLIISCFLEANSIIATSITKDTRWSGEIIIEGDIIVHPNVTLFIAPGTQIKINSNSDAKRSGKQPGLIELTVLGKIIAKGTKEKGKIKFSSNSPEPRMEDWYGIIIKNPKHQSQFKHCVIEYAYKGITCYGSSPLISDCSLQFNQYSGISCEVVAKPSIRRSIIFGNNFSGISCELSSMPLIEKCVISQNRNGIVISDQSRPDLGNKNPQGNQSAGENLIFNNLEMNIYNQSPNKINAQNNIWNTQNYSDISKNIFDKEDNPEKGKVVFSPLFSHSEPSSVVSTPKTTYAEEKNISQTRPVANQHIDFSPAKSTQKMPKKLDLRHPKISSYPLKKQSIQKPTYLSKKDTSSDKTSRESFAKPIIEPSLPKDTIETRKPPPPAVEEAIPRQPILEAFIDGGGRKYIKKIDPEYPKVYLLTEREGKVWINVTILKNGRIKSYKVIKSDGDYFTQSAIRALKQFRYQPATLKGKPVMFNVIETFHFYLQDRR